MDKKKPYKKGTYIALGIIFGSSLGIIFHNSVIGTSLGLIFGIILDSNARSKQG